MATWSKEKVLPDAVNGGNKLTTHDHLTLDAFNAIVDNGFYASDVAERVEALGTNAPDNSDAATVGTPAVSIIGEGAGLRFKFSQLKGEAGADGADGIGLYDIGIKTQSEFNALIASPTWLGAKSVVFDGGFTHSGGINVPQSVVSVGGKSGAVITITDIVAGFPYGVYGRVSTKLSDLIFALMADTGSEDTYGVYGFGLVDNLTVQMTSVGTGYNAGVSNVHFITNSRVSITATDAQMLYGISCGYAVNCTATTNGTPDIGVGIAVEYGGSNLTASIDSPSAQRVRYLGRIDPNTCDKHIYPEVSINLAALDWVSGAQTKSITTAWGEDLTAEHNPRILFASKADAVLYGDAGIYVTHSGKNLVFEADIDAVPTADIALIIQLAR